MDRGKVWGIVLAMLVLLCSIAAKAQPKVLMALPLEKIYVTSQFGMRADPMNHKRRRKHQGIDLKAKNDRVYAMLPGYVEDCGYSKTGGNYVKTRHGNMRCTYYHLSCAIVTKGQPLNAGEIIGISGNTGTRTTGPHLHLQVQICEGGEEKSVNPLPMLRYIEAHQL